MLPRQFNNRVALSSCNRPQPLIELLARLENTDLLRSIIAKANNPYWLVKELKGHAGLLEQWEAA